MEPIIDPKIFWLIDVLEKLSFGASIAAGIGGCMAGLGFIGSVLNDADETEEDKKAIEKARLLLKRGLILLVICGVVGLFVPSKKTMYQMVAASYVTTNNVEAVQNNLVDIISKIADGISKARSRKGE